MDSQLAQMNDRLTSLERDVAALTKASTIEKAVYSSKVDMHQLEVRIEEMETRLIRWMVATMIAVMWVTSTAVYSIVKLLQ